jgi:hypothetical protein
MKVLIHRRKAGSIEKVILYIYHVYSIVIFNSRLKKVNSEERHKQLQKHTGKCLSDMKLLIEHK